ncbi:MAG: hypothetical protein IT204_10390 [Fimbriimonadaceae bacterium]|nr:hypothetical protein [Fimbriimonadaceae bacterium]
MSEPRSTWDPELLSAAVDDELTAAEQIALSRLLADPEVTRELSVLHAVKAVSRRALPAQAVPVALLAKVQAGLDAIDAQPLQEVSALPRRAPLARRWKPFLAFAAAAAAIATFVPANLPRHGSLSATFSASTSRPAPPQVVISAASLASGHLRWRESFANQPGRQADPEQLAATLQQRVGRPVPAPNPVALGAQVSGCTTCPTVVPGQVAAVFVMQREQPADLTLVEVYDPQGAARLEGFRPSSNPAVRVAERDGVRIALWSEGPWQLSLVSSDTPLDELVKLSQQVRGPGGTAPASRSKRLRRL